MRNDEPSAPEDTAVSARRPGIGETLRATREFRRASVEYVAELLRIEPRCIVALEEERFDAIGPPVFVKGYLKHYCELLGIDSRPLLDELRQRLDGADPPLQARRSAERDDAGKSSAIVVAAVAAAAVATAAVWLFWEPAGDDGSEPEVAAIALPEEVPETSPAIPERSAPEDTAPASFPPGDGAESADAVLRLPFEAADSRDTEPGGSPAPSAEVPAPAGAPDVSGPLAAAAQGAASAPGEAGAGVEPTAAGSAAEPAASAVESGASSASTGAGNADAGAALEIELRFVEDSWTEVTAAGGERLFYGLARAGAEERILADSEVRVLLGNADGVIVRVNGAPFAYPSGSRNGDLARFRLSPEN